MLKFKILGFLAVLLVAGIPSVCRSELSNTYPTSAVTIVRLAAYEDGIFTIAKSTDTFKLNTWDVLGSSYTWVSSNQVVNGWWTIVVGTIPTVVPISIPLSTYTGLVYEQGWLRAVNKVLDHDIEQYFVLNSTYIPAGITWKGRCLSNTVKPYAVTCP